METKEFSSSEFVKFQVPFNYNDSHSEFFEGKLKQILGEGLKLKAFLQVIGYCFTVGNPHNKMFLFIGDGANGKTTLLSLIHALFGDSASAVSLHQFNNEFGMQPLLGKRVNILPDLPMKVIEDTGFIKAITGEDPVTVNRKHKEPITARLECKIIGSGNVLPPIEDNSFAFWRRIIHIELTKTFKGKDKDPDLKKKLINDQKGMEWLIYNAIQEYKKVKDDGWAIETSAEKHRKESLKVQFPCVYATEELFQKTNDSNDFISRDDVVKIMKTFLKAEDMEISSNLKDYYSAVRHRGYKDIERTINSNKVRGFKFIKLNSENALF